MCLLQSEGRVVCGCIFLGCFTFPNISVRIGIKNGSVPCFSTGRNFRQLQNFLPQLLLHSAFPHRYGKCQFSFLIYQNRILCSFDFYLWSCLFPVPHFLFYIFCFSVQLDLPAVCSVIWGPQSQHLQAHLSCCFHTYTSSALLTLKLRLM